MGDEVYIDLCYPTENALIKAYSKSSGDDFSKPAHYIWRLGTTREHADTVVRAFNMVPNLRRTSRIQLVGAQGIGVKTLHPKYLSPHEVLHSVLPETRSQNPLHVDQAFTRLQQLDPPLARPIYTKMTAQETILTRVHAELQLADTFSRKRDMEFVDNDWYIGCSKPACHFCYTWLCHHHHGYVPPATHLKIIPGCRGPDGNLNEAGARVTSQMYAEISQQIGQYVFEFLQQDAGPRKQYMSTEASTRAPSLFPHE